MPMWFYNAVDNYTSPIQYIIDAPAHLVRIVENYFVTLSTVRSENEQLRLNLYTMQGKLQLLNGLYLENMQLRNLLNAAPRFNSRFVTAEVLSVDIDPMVQHILINRGTDDGVYVGQPVFDGYGVLGQVIDTSQTFSRIMLISDRLSAVPVQVYRTGWRGLVGGTGQPNGLELMYVPEGTDIQPGDLLITSSLGSRYPTGYPVGQVVSLQRSAQQTFVTVQVKPYSHLRDSQQVLLVWPDKPMQMDKLLQDIAAMQNNNATAAAQPATTPQQTTPTAMQNVVPQQSVTDNQMNTAPSTTPATQPQSTANATAQTIPVPQQQNQISNAIVPTQNPVQTIVPTTAVATTQPITPANVAQTTPKPVVKVKAKHTIKTAKKAEAAEAPVIDAKPELLPQGNDDESQ